MEVYFQKRLRWNIKFTSELRLDPCSEASKALIRPGGDGVGNLAVLTLLTLSDYVASFHGLRVPT